MTTKPGKAPLQFGYEATFLDGEKRTGFSLNASTARVEIAYSRLQEGDAECYRQLGIKKIERRQDLDVLEAEEDEK